MQSEEVVAMDPDGEVEHDFRPFIQQYKSGRVVRFNTTDTIPAGTDTAGTGVSSKDVIINRSTGLWARLYLPALSAGRRDAKKLPVVVYYHGGAFVVGSTAHRATHLYLNGLAADANALIVPPSTASRRSSRCQRRTRTRGSASSGGRTVGRRARGPVARVRGGGQRRRQHRAPHRRARRQRARPRRAHQGLLVVHAYFNSEAAFGDASASGRAKSEVFWRFVCPGTPGLDDPVCNPFSDAANGSAARVAAERVLVCVAEKDMLRDRGVWYYEKLKASRYSGEVELLESMGVGHVFHYSNPGCEQARVLHARVLSFLRVE